MSPFYVLCEIAGFFLQTAPIAVLCFVPFSQEELRLPRKTIWALLTALAGVGSLGMGALSYITHSMGDTLFLENMLNLYMLLFMAVFAALYFWVVKAALAARVLPFILLIQYAAFLFIMNTILLQTAHHSFGYPYRNVSYHPLTVVTSFVLTSITFPLMVLFFRKVLRPMFPLMGRRDLSRGCYFFSAALVLYFIGVYLLAYTSNSLRDGPLLLALVTMTLTDMILYYIFFAQIHTAAKNRQLEEQLRQFDEQYRVFSGSVEEARRFRHDLRHHLNAIAELNRENRREELTAYLERYVHTYQALETQPLSGFFAVDNILRYYLARAQDEGVRFETQLGTFPNSLGFDPMDVTVLLGNLLENALEACRKIPRPEKRFLRLSLRQRGTVLLLSLSNSCPPNEADYPEFVSHAHFPSTKGGRPHGLGLKSVQLVADKYGGSAEYKRENGTFTVRVVLNIP